MKCLSLSRLLGGLATIALLSGVLPAAANAQPANYLIKGSGSTVYFNGNDGKRYVFPTEGVYKSWYPDYTSVALLNDSQLAAIPLGGNVTYKPGSTLVKITTDPRVYAVSQYGVLHWVTSEAVASQLYGAEWNKHVVDVPDAFFVNYTIGYQVDTAMQYDQNAELRVADPGANIKPASYVLPPQPLATPVVQGNTGTLSVTLSRSSAVQNQTEAVYASVQNSTYPITKIEIYKTAQSTPVMTCLNTTTCSYQFFITTAPLTETYFAIATDSKNNALTVPDAGRATLTVSAASDQVQLSVIPQTATVGDRVSFSSTAVDHNTVSSHQIYALIPGQVTPVLWKDCGATDQCSGSTPFYRTTDLYAQVVMGGQSFISPTTRITVQGGDPPKPLLAVTGHPAPNQVEIMVTAPYGETIGQTQIKDGTSLDDATLALCNQSTCSIILQVNVPGSVTAFTNVGGKYEPSNTVTVTP